ncbi:hypothetical protein LTR50_002115 [Elasticomyces elasticus]|nr:hypothetical protein LTR50_002115 [Elasticomyces elasticus]
MTLVMSQPPLFPTSLPDVLDTLQSSQLPVDGGTSTATSQWFTPTSYAYEDPYMTPFPSSAVEAAPWPSYLHASEPNPGPNFYPLQHIQVDPLPLRELTRPKSSPSTFRRSGETILWPSNALGIRYTGPEDTPSTCSSYVPTTYSCSTYSSEPLQAPFLDHYVMSSPPIRQPEPRRSYPTIAPSPKGIAQLHAAKRHREDDEPVDTASSTNNNSKKRTRTSSIASSDLNEEDRFLVQLKEEESLPWKEIAARFGSELGRQYQVAALQMRYKRLRERVRVWEARDVEALRLAHEYWERSRFEIVGAKMLDFGVTERWPARHCARKWAELELAALGGGGGGGGALVGQAAGMTPTTVSQYSSPVEATGQFAFMSMP